MMNTVRDNLLSNDSWTIITSGSFGEGLQMRGSDLDIMGVLEPLHVFENTPVYLNPNKANFTMEMEDMQLGFTKLRLAHSDGFVHVKVIDLCVKESNGFYLSNLLFKQTFSSNVFATIHGPCVSDKYGVYDIAYCLHCKLWITPAKQWVIRSKHSWPRCDVKQSIVKHGVLFVPVGVKGSNKEELGWRISFSVAEKLLIYSFTHTQLLCYALMKILLKDVIASDADCKELLCSYFIKTILFWICEELSSAIWKPENLIFCFMRCFKRLIYCVEYLLCPHYFIPENNLFENRIQGLAQKTLLNKLYFLNIYGWQCILLSDQFTNLIACMSNETKFSYANSVERLLNSNLFFSDSLGSSSYFLSEKCIYKVLSSKSSKVKYLYTYYLSKLRCKIEQIISVGDIPCNTSTYKEYNSYISKLLLNTHHDAVSGWLILASFFYARKQYNTALHIIKYSLFKCTPEKLHQFMQISDIHYELFNLHLIRNMPIIQLWKFLRLDIVSVYKSRLQPNGLEVQEQQLFPPIVYAKFLRFLCHYYLKRSKECFDSLMDLQLTIDKSNFKGYPVLKGVSYIILAKSFQLLGDTISARQAFGHSLEFFTINNIPLHSDDNDDFDVMS